MTVAEDTVLPFQLPIDWQATYVGTEFFLILGKMLDAEKNVGVPRPYLGNKSVQWGCIDTEDLSLIKLTPGDLRRYRLMDGDLLVCEGGDIGRSAIWRGQLEECYFQKALHRVRPRGGFSPVLLRYLLEYYSKTGFLLNFATQTSIAHLPKDKFEVLPLPKPPMVEQEAIAEALSDADALIEGLERLIAKKRLIKQGAMQDLLTAKRRLPGFSGEWTEAKLGAISRIITGPFGTLLKASEYGGKDGVPLIPVGEVRDGYFRITSETPRISTEVLKRLPQYILRKGDIVFGRKGGVERSSIVTDDQVGWFLGSDGIVVRFHERFNADFFGHLVRSPKVKEFLLMNALGTTMPSLNQSVLGAVPIQYPGEEEQSAISGILADMDTEIQALETRLEKARQVKEGMMQNLLTGRIRLV
ncbi:restriction endonuclease subunit S [uncultured Jannaschia sp.]|uniref:restriction endonuclease subunit S n=1 Tax=uncultured Jannaschia sp. TaxID=293347 RepID=UPI00261A8BF3|nr:restriction endonuclease subunit S [uncultured Jannaschia sp.]